MESLPSLYQTAMSVSPVSSGESCGRILGTDIRMGSGFHPQSSGQVEIFNKLLEQTLRCTVHQLGESRDWVRLLPTVEFAVNNSPNRTTGYSAFFLNYGYHPLHPLQLLHSPGDSNIESVIQFTSRLREDFSVALHQLNRAREQMIHQTTQKRQALTFQEGEQVLLSTKNIRFRRCPTKLQRRYVGPFRIIQKVSDVAYRLCPCLRNGKCIQFFMYLCLNSGVKVRGVAQLI